MTSTELRRAFCDFFVGKGHTLVPSAPLVPMGDPTLLFTNAGMVQFKKTFLGEEPRPYRRAVSVQKCLRAGGKHNDLENVGVTARHHTFFEMLGNFSFGDYFKKEAIETAWEFLTRTLHLPSDRLWVSVYREDDEAFGLWRDHIGLAPDRIVRLGEKDNFWQMGETGPCGPCSEILFDQGAEVGCGRAECAVGCECDRYLEIWNLVFMQYERTLDGTLVPLPKPSIDTGMGLERITAVVQGVHSNYDTDLFQPLVQAISEMAGSPYGRDPKADVSIRVIADHLRAVIVLLTEGVLPSNEGRGYVLRRILRRAARHGRMLGQKEPFLHHLSERGVALMQGAYPEVRHAQETIRRILRHEEERFIHTLDQGEILFQEAAQRAQSTGGRILPGEDVFRLYDTYGFPIDLIHEMAGDLGFGVDLAGFDLLLERQRERARRSWLGGEDRVSVPRGGRDETDRLYQDWASRHRTLFLGYETLDAGGRVIGMIRNGCFVQEVFEGEDVEVLFDRTPFYGESGGQLGDRGVGSGPHGTAEIVEVSRPMGLIVHRLKVVSGGIANGEDWTLRVSQDLRQGAARHHTATHLLHAALRQILGNHVRQAGSLVAPERLRFDFTHFEPMSSGDRDYLEEVLNEKIMENLTVTTGEMEIETALQSGAMALFGEKYDERVRVVQIGEFSRELCGGTHCRATGDIGFFALVQETGIASGVRRIEAMTGAPAFRYIKEQEGLLKEASALLKARPVEIVTRVEKLLAQLREQEKTLDRFKMKTAVSQSQELLSRARSVEDIHVLSAQVDDMEMKDLRGLADSVKESLGSGLLVLGSVKDGKVSLVAGVSRDLLGRFHAGDILKEIAPLVGGGGGGRPDMAQAGGKDASGLGRALDRVYEIIKRRG
jgi:alanyl-tRNA synthetase